MKTSAFSLTELTVVLLIVAIVAGAVALRVQGPLGRAQVNDVVGAVASFARTTRAAAREQDRPMRLVVDLSAGTLRRTDDHGRAIGGPALTLPDGFSVHRLLLERQDVTASDVAIPCSRRGLMPTCGLEFRGRGQRQWVVVAGLTGELVQVDSEQEARKIVAATGVRRHAR